MNRIIIGIAIIIIGIAAVFTGFGWRANQVLPVSEWSDVFDITCSCGNPMHCEPYDRNHYKIECNKCDKVYEKDWDAKRYE